MAQERDKCRKLVITNVTSRPVKSGNLTVCEIRCSRTMPSGVTYPSLGLR
jgi:hypothetical protein